MWWRKSKELRKTELIGQILAEEEELISAHRGHVDAMVELMKELSVGALVAAPLPLPTRVST